MNLLRLFSVFALFVTLTSAKVLSYNELKDKPKGLVKDYYINRLINEGSYTKEQILKLSKDVFRSTGAVKKAIDKILPSKPFRGTCSGFGAKNILDANNTCQNTLTTMVFSLKLSTDVREKLALNLQSSHPKKSEILLSLNTQNPAKTFADNNNTSSFISLFNASSDELKHSYFSTKFSPEFMDALYNEKGFTQILINLVLERKLDEFRANFLNITPQKSSKNDAFFLGLNAITLNNESKARDFFTIATNTYEFASQQDNAKFWLYLLGDREILNELANSKDINIYSLYAKEVVNSEPFDAYVPRPKIKNAGEPDITDPFVWQSIALSAENMDKATLENMAQKFYTKDSIAAYVYLKQKANGWKKHYYIMPQSEALSDTNTTRKSLIFAIARQESLFLPAVVSTSYALGTMQFMPFLANAIGKKELKIPNFDQDDMFKPDVAYRFANHHLNYLEKFLQHPLFIAYAYNGGIGFTKRLLLRDDMFRDGKFEPFLSMELVPYSESRLYGKKVLANYVVYSSLMGSNIRISQLFEILTQPHLTDKFRK